MLIGSIFYIRMPSVYCADIFIARRYDHLDISFRRRCRHACLHSCEISALLGDMKAPLSWHEMIALGWPDGRRHRAAGAGARCRFWLHHFLLLSCRYRKSSEHWPAGSRWHPLALRPRPVSTIIARTMPSFPAAFAIRAAAMRPSMTAFSISIAAPFIFRKMRAAMWLFRPP